VVRRRRQENAAAALGRRVRQLREANGWTQERLAERADLDRSYIAGIEVGRRNPSLNALEKLSSAFGLDLADLFHRGQ
jgi:transcriptional regulator with XRE-family HTH domain